MPFYVVTGRLGAGKTLAMVGRLAEYMRRGRPVATNVNLHLRKLLKKPPTERVTRLPDQPSAADLQLLGAAHDTGREELNGCLVLDECGTWLNARTWNHGDRAAIIDWLLHSRKLGWDVYLIAQSLTMIDKQLRDALCEYHVTCRRLDRINVPFVGRLGRALTLGLWSGRMPGVHVASVRYGTGPSSVGAETWVYRGVDLWGAYDTVQVIGQATATHSLIWPSTEAERAEMERRRRKPKLPAVRRLAAMPKDEAWRYARQLVPLLP